MMTARSKRMLSDRVRDAFTQRLGYKAAALFFAIVLWVGVSAEEPMQATVPVRWPDRGDGSWAEAPEIRATVVGRGHQLLRLYFTPPKLAFDTGSFAGRVDITPKDVILPSGVEATVSDVQPRSFVVTFPSRTYSKGIP